MFPPLQRLQARAGAPSSIATDRDPDEVAAELYGAPEQHRHGGNRGTLPELDANDAQHTLLGDDPNTDHSFFTDENDNIAPADVAAPEARHDRGVRFGPHHDATHDEPIDDDDGSGTTLGDDPLQQVFGPDDANVD